MADIAKFVEGGAFGVFNDILSTFHSDDGYAVPNRFECLILPPFGAIPERSDASGNYRPTPLDANDARATSMR